MVRLLVHAPYYRPHVGGLETYVEEVGETLWATGEVEALTVLTPAIPEGAPAQERQPDGTLILRYPAFEPITGFPLPKVWSRGWRVARRAAFGMRPDVVVGHTRFFPSSALALLDARRLGARHVHVEHGADFVQMTRRVPNLVARVYDETLGRMVLRQADARIAVSAAAAAFVRRLGRVDADVVHRGLPKARLAAAAPAPEASSLAAGRPLVVFVGRLMDGKGVHDLIDAVDGLEQDAACVIVGDGPARAPWEARAAAATHPERFHFLGFLPEEEALAWIAAADVVANPSYTEGFGLTVLWGAACGRAVVASAVGGVPEIVTDGVSALLHEPRDVAGLRTALATALADRDLRARLGAAARADAWARFDEERAARQWLAVARGDRSGAAATYAPTAAP